MSPVNQGSKSTPAHFGRWGTNYSRLCWRPTGVPRALAYHVHNPCTQSVRSQYSRRESYDSITPIGVLQYLIFDFVSKWMVKLFKHVSLGGILSESVKQIFAFLYFSWMWSVWIVFYAWQHGRNCVCNQTAADFWFERRQIPCLRLSILCVRVLCASTIKQTFN